MSLLIYKHANPELRVLCGIVKKPNQNLSAAASALNNYLGEQRGISTSLYTWLRNVAGRLEDEIGRLKDLCGILSGRWNIKNDKFDRFYDVIGFCMAIHNLKRFYDVTGLRKEGTPEWTPECAQAVRTYCSV